MLWGRGFSRDSVGTNLPADAGEAGDTSSIPGTGGDEPLEEEMATHSSILAWKIPRTEEPGELQPMGPQRVEHSWASEYACYDTREMVVGYHSCGHIPSDKTLVADWNWRKSQREKRSAGTGKKTKKSFCELPLEMGVTWQRTEGSLGGINVTPTWYLARKKGLGPVSAGNWTLSRTRWSRNRALPHHNPRFQKKIRPSSSSISAVWDFKRRTQLIRALSVQSSCSCTLIQVTINYRNSLYKNITVFDHNCPQFVYLNDYSSTSSGPAVH